MFINNEPIIDDLPPKGSALVIGLNKLDLGHYAGWSGELAGALNDAKTFARWAEQSASTIPGGESETITLLDERATRQHVKEKILEAAAYLRGGDLFLLYFAGYGGVLPQIGGASDREVHKTWCLYDGQLLEEELYSLLVNFHSGVRVLIIKDTSHAGVRTQERYAHDPDLHHAVSKALTDTGVRARSMPQKVASKVYLHNKDFYDDLLRQAPAASVSTDRAHASVQLLAASKDNQDALERDTHGLFSEALFRILDFGRFEGGHDDLHQAIAGSLPPIQSPHHELVADSGDSFVRHQPLSLSNAVLAAPAPAPSTKIAPPNSKTPSQFTNSYSTEAENAALTLKDVGTIEFWAAARGWPKWKVRTEDACIFSVHNGDLALLVSLHRDKLLLKIGDQTFPVAFDWTDGGYHHLSFNPLRGQLTMDGATPFDFKVDPQTKASLLNISLSPFAIGVNDGAQFFEGDIRGVRLWKNNLQPEEIKISANFSAKSTQPPLPPNLAYHSGTPGLAPAKLLAYQYEDARKKSLFVFHLEPAGSWIFNTYDQADDLQVETVTAPDGTEYGGVEYVPFIGLFRDLEQNLLLATDENTDPIKLLPSGPNTYTIDGAPKISLEVAMGKNCSSTLSNSCIHISAPIPNTRLPKGDYVPSLQDGDNASFTQTLGDVFTQKGTNIDMMLTGWVPYDQAYNPVYPGQKTADNNVFSFPDSDTKRYREGGEGGSVATPYGLFRRTVSFQTGSFSSTLVTSIQEYEQEVLRVRGFDIGQNVNLLFLSRDLSYSRTTTVKDVNAQIVEHDRTLAVTHFMELDYAAYLERRNATLSDKFKQMVDKLVKNPSTALLDNIIAMFGTHYTNAITYGGRGLSQSTLAKDSVVTLVKQGVNIQQGLNYSLGLNVEDVGGVTDSGSASAEDASDWSSKITAANEVQVESFNCYGSVSCDGGKPAAGNAEHTQPLYLDLRPLSDLLAPPFYSDYASVVTARKKLAQAIQAKAADALKPPKTGILFVRLSVEVTTDMMDIATDAIISAEPSDNEKLAEDLLEVPTITVFAVAAGEDNRAILENQAIQPLQKGKYTILAVPAGTDSIELQLNTWQYDIKSEDDPDERFLGMGDTEHKTNDIRWQVAKAATASILISDLSPEKAVQGAIQSDMTITETDTDRVTHHRPWPFETTTDTTESTVDLGPAHPAFEISYSLQLLQPNQVFTTNGLDVDEIV